MKPSPQQVDCRPRGEELVQRDVFCPNYNVCLEYVLKQGWDNWTCVGCPLYQGDRTPSATTIALLQPKDR